MIVTATLTLRLADERARRDLAAVLAPDNEGLPRGLSLSVTGEGDVLRFGAESSSPSQAVSTVLALLRDITLFQEVWRLSRTRRA